VPFQQRIALLFLQKDTAALQIPEFLQAKNVEEDVSDS
jgi:hypothetical protein